MNWTDWYTDRMDVCRVVDVQDGALTRHERQQVLKDIPCRIYRESGKPPTMSQQAASIQQSSKLACDNAVGVHAGDELLIYRGGGLGVKSDPIRAFAGDPHQYYEPFGAVRLGLAHQEIELLQQERIK